MPTIIVIAKYAVSVAIVVVVAMAPAWLACQTKKDKTYSGIIRVSSWLFGWTGIGWLIALFLAIRK